MKRPFPLAVSIVALCAFGGLVIFGIMTWRSTSIDRLEPADAAQRLEAVRQRFGRAAPVLQLGADGTVISRRPPNERPDAVISKIIVVTYDASAQRLTETRIPFWFFRIKAPAAEYAFGGTGLDFHQAWSDGRRPPRIRPSADRRSHHRGCTTGGRLDRVTLTVLPPSVYWP